MKNLIGKKAFIAGVADDKGFGWAIAKALAEAGCEIIIGTWVPVVKIFKGALANGKLDTQLKDGSHLSIAAIYPMDGSFDSMEDVPASILENKRYKDVASFTISDVANLVEKDFGKIDFLVHSFANAPEVKKPLLETSRQGYLDAVSASSYSFVSMVRHFSPHMNKGGSILNLSYVAAQQIVPGYGGGMSSAKAALESDTKTLAFEAGRKYGLRVNAISAGPIESRAAKAIGFIEKMTAFAQDKSPMQNKLTACQVGKTARFLLSDDASAITASTIYVDNGLHAMGPSPEEEQADSLPASSESLLHPTPLA
ncbi:MAG: Enoyl-[acyl-carrier-protein] reductase [NADH] FabI [Chlamydiia bacterium]|nr:Enoyl-[acyl-carrier-protein] reductase [NADH] FabI [Chlamydiia bacterium]MCH9618208.1 Enoyl-[acyl-carrier-protein] reductase [NADH] FabI [Chlamydiia bacterium]MCH9624069.1 Enoyl-[acyl-carrier-protein] reductase [NADH] FabI [Chlamydiia bacterium]